MEEIKNTSVATRIGIEERLKPVCSESSPVGSTPTPSTKKKTGSSCNKTMKWSIMDFNETVEDALKNLKKINSLFEASCSSDFLQEGELFEEEDINKKELNLYLLRITNDIVALNKLLKSNSKIAFNLKQFKLLITDILHLNTKFHNDDDLSEVSIKMHNDLMSNIAVLNNQIMEWNEKHEQKLPTIPEIRQLIKEAADSFFAYFNY